MTLQEKITEALEIMKGVKFEEMELGRHDIHDDLFLLIQEYDSKTFENMRYEAHEKYVDIQYVVSGTERIFIAPTSIMKVQEAYSPERDVVFFENIDQACSVTLTDGGYAILYPADAHKPGVMVDGPVPVKKIVGKVRI